MMNKNKNFTDEQIRNISYELKRWEAFKLDVVTPTTIEWVRTKEYGHIQKFAIFTASRVCVCYIKESERWNARTLEYCVLPASLLKYLDDNNFELSSRQSQLVTDWFIGDKDEL